MLCHPPLVALLEEHRCLGCGIITHPGVPKDHPEATRVQASGAYVLCTRCEQLARAELAARESGQAGPS